MNDARYHELQQKVQDFNNGGSAFQLLKQEFEEDLFPLISKSTEESTRKVRPIASQRSIRRLLIRFDLDRLVEIATPAELQQEIRTLLEGIKTSAAGDAHSARVLRQLLESLKINSKEQTQEDSYLGVTVTALSRVEQQTMALMSLADADNTQDSLVQLLLPVQTEIARDWSTVEKRLRWPTLLAILAFLFGLYCYSLISLFLPSVVFAGLLVFLPVLIFLLSYWVGNSRLDRKLDKRRKLLQRLDPDLDQYGSFWETSAPQDVLADISKRVRGFTPTDYSSLSRGWTWRTFSLGARLVFFGLVIMAILGGLLALAHLSWQVAPDHQVVLRGWGTQAVCGETGKILWAGPVDVVMWNTDSRLAVVRRSELLYIQVDSKDPSSKLPICGQTAATSSQAINKVKPAPAAEPMPALLVLFEPVKIHSPPRSPLRLTVASRKQIKLLNKWISECTMEKVPVKVTVKGFASKKPFSDVSSEESKARNYALAQERRTAVLGALGVPVLAPGFGNYDEMNIANPFKSISDKTEDVTEQMARSSLIVITDAGSCKN